MFPWNSFAHRYQYLKHADTTNWKRIGETINRQFDIAGLLGLLSAGVNIEILYFLNVSTRLKPSFVKSM